MSEHDAEIERFYSETYREEGRLQVRPHGRLEFARTKELLRRFLRPPPARVLDIGGGTGVHAAWLADDGYQVHLIDPVERHVDLARQFGSSALTVATGDARAVEEGDASADAVLLLGPLYHLVERSDRLRALREARRVLRPGGLIAASVVSRHAALLDFMAKGRLEGETLRLTESLLQTGLHDARLGFTTAHFHTPSEVTDEFMAAGFPAVEVIGIEGPGWIVLDSVTEQRVESLMPSALTCARVAERDPALISTSGHLLCVAQRGP